MKINKTGRHPGIHKLRIKPVKALTSIGNAIPKKLGPIPKLKTPKLYGNFP